MIKELIHLGKLNPSDRYAEIEVDIKFINEKKLYKGIRAFIDTGAARSCVQRRLISEDIDLNSGLYKEGNSHGASGGFKSIKIPDVSVRLNALFNETTGIPLSTIDVIDSPKMLYEVIIGNDILMMCEFMYNGLSETYLLKIFYDEPEE